MTDESRAAKDFCASVKGASAAIERACSDAVAKIVAAGRASFSGSTALGIETPELDIPSVISMPAASFIEYDAQERAMQHLARKLRTASRARLDEMVMPRVSVLPSDL